ncbi:MAG: GntP family permease [Lysobacterales bacterium]
MSVELAFFIGLTVLLVLAIPLKVNAFVSLILSAATIGLLSGMGMEATVTGITAGFGNTVSKIGIIIIFGVILGQYLEDSRAAESLARAAVKAVGEKRSPIAMAMSGYVISIPVFSDVGYVILASLAKAISRASQVSFYVIAVSLSAGLLATHVFVPPTPGPLAVAGLLDIEIGRMIIWGGFAAFGMTLGGWAWAQFVIPRYMETYIPGEEETAARKDESEMPAEEMPLPGAGVSAVPLLLPLFLILSDTTAGMTLPEGHAVLTVTGALGDANVAMVLGAASALLLLGKRLAAKGKSPLTIIDASLKSAGPIIFITAAGGSLGAILNTSGAGGAIAELIAGSGLPFILVPFAISGILKTIQGSGTIAVITAATLCLPIANQLQLDPILIALAAGSGARLICHVNDSYFWVFANMSGFDTKTALKTLSAANLAMAFAGLFATWIASLVIQ